MELTKNKFVVYTALFGDYDDLIEPKEKFEGCDFICFTDQKSVKSDIWEIRTIDECNMSKNMMNRKFKILPHIFLGDYDLSLYIDANIAILNNPLILANKYLSKYDIAVPKHFARNCLYKEAKECVILGKTKYRETKKQIKKYENDGFPKNFGLGENNILFRKHNSSKVVKIMNDWWNELNTQTQRDQLSFAYVLWKNNEKFNFIDESSREKNRFFKYLNHNQYKNRNILNKLFDKIIILFKRMFYGIIF